MYKCILKYLLIPTEKQVVCIRVGELINTKLSQPIRNIFPVLLTNRLYKGLSVFLFSPPGRLVILWGECHSKESKWKIPKESTRLLFSASVPGNRFLLFWMPVNMFGSTLFASLKILNFLTWQMRIQSNNRSITHQPLQMGQYTSLHVMSCIVHSLF